MKIIHYSEQKATIIDNNLAKCVLGRVVIGNQDGASNFFMRVFELKNGSYTPQHSHDWEHEIFVHSGEGEVFCDNQWVTVSSGSVVFIPGGDRHQFRNVGVSLFTFVCLVPSFAPEM